MSPQSWPGLALLFLCASTAAAEPDADVVACDRSDGWAVMDATGGAGHGTIAVGKGREGRSAIELRFERVAGGPVALMHAGLLTDLRRLEFDVCSEKDAPLLLVIEDRDHAHFHCTRPLAAGAWQHLALAPADFTLAEDSPTRKAGLEPARLGVGFAFVDLGGVLGEKGPNVLHVAGLRIERAALADRPIPTAIEGTTIEVGASGRHAGDIVVRAGGTLRLTAPRFVLKGNVRLEAGGAFVVTGTALTLESVYVHQRKIEATGDARIALRDVVMRNDFLPSFELHKGARLEIDGYQPAGAPCSTDVEDGASVVVRRAKGIGEFMIFPGAHATFEESSFALLWITLGPHAKGRGSLPPGEKIGAWSLDPGLGIDLKVAACENLMWGLISAPGSDYVLADSRLTSAGITLYGAVELSGIKNGAADNGARLRLADRKLELPGTTVETWNLYAAPGSRVTLKDCVVGECWSFGDAELTMIDSRCDGTGGYVKAQDTSTFRLVGCRLEAEVIAEGAAHLTLERCVVTRNLSASGHAQVKLAGTQVQGTVQRLDAAQVEEAR